MRLLPCTFIVLKVLIPKGFENVSDYVYSINIGFSGANLLFLNQRNAIYPQRISVPQLGRIVTLALCMDGHVCVGNIKLSLYTDQVTCLFRTFVKFGTCLQRHVDPNSYVIITLKLRHFEYLF
jgi:hypothetical protein